MVVLHSHITTIAPESSKSSIYNNVDEGINPKSTFTFSACETEEQRASEKAKSTHFARIYWRSRLVAAHNA
jgi:hypothetical protein